MLVCSAAWEGLLNSSAHLTAQKPFESHSFADQKLSVPDPLRWPQPAPNSRRSMLLHMPLWSLCLFVQPQSCLLLAFLCHLLVSGTGSGHLQQPPLPRDLFRGIVLTDRHLNYPRASSATGLFTWGVLGSRFFISLLGLAEPRFIDLQAMPQNHAVVLGFSREGYRGRPRHYGTFCWSTFSDAELLKSLYFIMIAVVPEVSVDCLYINQK